MVHPALSQFVYPPTQQISPPAESPTQHQNSTLDPAPVTPPWSFAAAMYAAIDEIREVPLKQFADPLLSSAADDKEILPLVAER
ncbi:hypothetical protein LTS15_008071 [Exophiala xenobiotica]|nr:hypothetical protein LTS15_008071 [Exophiala xenobiotica]